VKENNAHMGMIVGVSIVVQVVNVLLLLCHHVQIIQLVTIVMVNHVNLIQIAKVNSVIREKIFVQLIIK
jgi:hypothetical protein